MSHAQAVAELGRRGLSAAVTTGALVRLSRGWYATPSADTSVVRAVRARGRLGCMSAARLHGLWVPPDPQIHVVRRRGWELEGPLPTPDGVRFHSVRRWSGAAAVVSVWECLEQVVKHHDAETALVVVESVLNRGLITLADVTALTAGLPPPRQRVLARAIPTAESGSETRVRLWFERRGVPVRSQAVIAGVGRVDLLVGRSQIVELDSRAHHTGVDRYAEDRRRDLVVAPTEYRVLRLTYQDVWQQWAATEQVLALIVRRRRYRRAPL